MFGLGIGAPEIVVVLVVGLLLFGNKLPSMARSLGNALAEFRREANGLADDALSRDR